MSINLNEDQLKKEEALLYLDLVVTELDNKKTSDIIKAENIKLKNEIDSLRKSLCVEKEKNSQISAENVTLKKNICSLYKTAKSEIEQKDSMLLEANKKIDKMLIWCERKGISYKEIEDHFKSKDQDWKNYRKQNFEGSESYNQTFSRPSTSFNQPEINSKWNKVNSEQRFSSHNLEKQKDSPSPDAGHEKANNSNYTDKRNSSSKSESNQTSHVKWNQVNSKHRFSSHKSEKHKHSPSPDAGNEKCNSYSYADRRNSFNKSIHTSQNNKRNYKKQKCDN